MKSALLIALALIAIPVHAQEIGGDSLSTYLPSIVGFINSILVPFLFAIAFIAFIWGIIQYFIMGGANEEQREKGKSLVMWGIIGFFVMISLWGMVNLLVNTFDFGGQNAPTLPTFSPGAPNVRPVGPASTPAGSTQVPVSPNNTSPSAGGQGYVGSEPIPF